MSALETFAAMVIVQCMCSSSAEKRNYLLEKYLIPTRSSRSESVRPYVRTYVCTPLLEMLIKMLHDGHKCKIEVCLKVPMKFMKDQEGSIR